MNWAMAWTIAIPMPTPRAQLVPKKTLTPTATATTPMIRWIQAHAVTLKEKTWPGAAT